VGLDSGRRFPLLLRIPGWCRRHSVSINGKEESGFPMESGFLRLERDWKDGDRVELELHMPVVLRESDPAVRENRGKLAIQRGPLIYCLEEADNGKELDSLELEASAIWTVERDSGTLEGAPVLKTANARRRLAGTELYPESASGAGAAGTDLTGTDASGSADGWSSACLTAVPFYARCNRELGEMIVWVNRACVRT
jgi:DUF1680 family protein